MIKKIIIFTSCVLGMQGICSPTYVTDGTNSDPPGAVYSIDTSTDVATNTVSNSLRNPFSRPLGVALSPEGTFAYVTDWNSSRVYYIDVPSNTATRTVPGGFEAPNAVAISSDSTFAYVADYGNNTVYYIDVATNRAAPTTNSIGSFSGPVVPAISLDATFAYVTNISTAAVFRIDPKTNATTAQVSGSFQSPIGVAISNDGTRAYVADSAAPALFSIDTQTNIATKIESDLFQNPYGVAISPDGKTVYIADPGAEAVFYFNAATQQIIQQVDFTYSAPDWAISPIAISPDGTSLYVAGGNSATIWHIDIASGTPTQIANGTMIPYNSPTSVATLPPLIITRNSSSNNLSTANYLNANQPYVALRQIVPLQGNALNNALEMISPTRNTFATFASQIAQIAMGRLVNDHQRQDRWRKKESPNAPLASNESLLSSNEIIGRKKGKTVAPPKSHSVWLGTFGQYAHEKQQHQTPAFDASTGGVVLAWDCQGAYPSPIGLGAAYAYTYIHEKDGFGHANISQGDLFGYATFPISNWYFDGAIWGGYYHIGNLRKISFPGVEMEASFSTHGWQLTPHLEAGYDYRSNFFGVEPFAMCDWVNCWEHKAIESGAPDFNMGQKGRYCSLLRGEAGIRFEQISSLDWGTITVMEKASYAYQKTFFTGELHAFLVNSANFFTVSTLIGAQNLGVAELEILFDPKNKKYPYASLSGHVELGSKYQTYQGMLELGKSF